MEREIGIAVGNMIVAARSAAAFYSTFSVRNDWVLTFIRDILNGDAEPVSRYGPYRNIHAVFPNWARAVREFCAGVLSISKFSLMGDRSTVAMTGSREAVASGPPGTDANDIRYGRNPIEPIDVDGRAWQHAVRQVATIANDAYADTELKIEFERVYELDTLSGGGPLSTARFNHAAVTAAESVKAIAPFGFLNRAAVFGVAERRRVRYKSYMFGSNVILFDNDLTNHGSLDASMPAGTDRRHLQRALDMSDVELKRFISNIVTVSGGTMSNAKRSRNGRAAAKRNAKRRRGERRYDNGDGDDDGDDFNSNEDVDPPYKGCVEFTSFNRLNNSLQFTFNTQGGRHYFSANVLLLKADDFCTNDLVYRRAAVSSLCQCERPALVWRACVLVTPINCASVEGGTRVEVIKVVMAALTALCAVYQHKRSTVDSRLAVVSGFLALPIPPYANRSTRPTRNRAADTSGGGSGNNNNTSSLSELCVFHRWLRAHSGSEWVVSRARSGSEALIRLMDGRGGRAVVVQRPVLMTGTTSSSAGKRSFVRFMTYEDSVKKMLRLTVASLTNGLSDSGADENCAVAYVRGKHDLIVFQRAGSNFVREDDGNLIESERIRVGGPARLWRALFEAPSRLYVDFSVLTSMGFNVVGIERAGRTFRHRDYGTRNTCTVFCSVQLRVVEDHTFRVINGDDDEEAGIKFPVRNVYTGHTEGVNNGGGDAEIRHGFDVLRGKDNRFESVTRTERRSHTDTSIRSRVRETVYNVNDYWPGTDLVKTDFVDPELKHVCFVYFTGGGGGDSRMTLEGLHAFSDYCARQLILPPPILFTIQRMVLKASYA